MHEDQKLQKKKKRQPQAAHSGMYFYTCDAILESSLDFKSKAGAFVLPAAPPTTTRSCFYIYSPGGRGEGEDADQVSCILIADGLCLHSLTDGCRLAPPPPSLLLPPKAERVKLMAGRLFISCFTSPRWMSAHVRACVCE